MRRLLPVSAVVAAALLAAAATAHADPEYFPLPAGYSYGQGLDVSPDGIVYFGASRPSSDPLISQRPPIGRLDPVLASSGTSNGMTFLVTPTNVTCCATQLRGLAWSVTTGTLYWTRSDGVVGRYDASGGMQSTTLHAEPWGIAAAPDGTAWFTENSADNSANWYGNRVGQVTPGLGINELVDLAHQTGVKDSTRYDAKPLGITVAANGTPWFAEAENGLPGYRIGSVAGNTYVEYFPPCVPGAYCSGVDHGTDGISDVAVAQDGSIWYTNELKRTIGRLIPGATVTEYSLNTMAAGLAAGRPRALRIARDGTLWLAVYGSFGAPSANAIVRIVPGDPPTATVYKLGATLAPWNVAPDQQGNVWFIGSPNTGPALVGRLAGVLAGAQPPATGSGNPSPAPPTTTLQPATTAVAKVSDPRVRGESITANQICVGPPQDRCSLVYLIQTHEYVTGFPGSRASAKPKLVTIGKLTVTLKGGQSKKVTIKLNAKGRKLLKKAKKLKSTLTVTQSRNGAKPKTILKQNVTFKRGATTSPRP
jgi:streptogramin lyase